VEGPFTLLHVCTDWGHAISICVRANVECMVNSAWSG